MGIDVFFLAVLSLAGFAMLDLTVGVANDAVNFLNSAIGARVAPRKVILAVASLGILLGVTFSSGMMEVARKGIFHPELFTMPDLMAIFIAVMLTDIILLDLFNTFGLPTSTTVSIVFALLGSSIAVSLGMLMRADQDVASLAQYINTSKVMAIIGGIFLSIMVSFIVGSLAQLFTRLLFTFDYAQRLRRYGAIWGGVACASITYFILVKGAKGASFISAAQAQWIDTHATVILLSIFAVSAVFLQILLLLRVNILKLIVLIGTFALAMAFAANDLVNFIGVPMAGYNAYQTAMASDSPETITMGALSHPVTAETSFLLISGAIMSGTLWFSKKARTVTETEIRLGRQEEGVERFESSALSRVIVRMAIGFLTSVKRIIPHRLLELSAKRLDTGHYVSASDEDSSPSFDIIRAAVNLVVASALISYATSYKLPLSTTYVTFMVAMGSSFADQAWGRESAVYRITGVLTVVGGWFVTAITAFCIAFLFAVCIFYGQVYGVAALLAFGTVAIWKNHHKHKQISETSEMEKVFNMKDVTSISETISVTFEQTGILLHEIRVSLDAALNGLFQQNQYVLNAEKNRSKTIQRWANIIVANIFKAMRLLQREDGHLSYRYGQTIRRLQKLADGHRDIVVRAHQHVSNHHKGLLEVQQEELSEVMRILNDIFLSVESTFNQKQLSNISEAAAKDKQLRNLVEQYHQEQMERIRNGASKTRLSILFYAILGNIAMLSRQNVRLLEIFSDSFGNVQTTRPFDLD